MPQTYEPYKTRKIIPITNKKTGMTEFRSKGGGGGTEWASCNFTSYQLENIAAANIASVTTPFSGRSLESPYGSAMEMLSAFAAMGFGAVTGATAYTSFVLGLEGGTISTATGTVAVSVGAGELAAGAGAIAAIPAIVLTGIYIGTFSWVDSHGTIKTVKLYKRKVDDGLSGISGPTFPTFNKPCESGEN